MIRNVCMYVCMNNKSTVHVSVNDGTVADRDVLHGGAAARRAAAVVPHVAGGHVALPALL